MVHGRKSHISVYECRLSYIWFYMTPIRDSMAHMTIYGDAYISGDLVTGSTFNFYYIHHKLKSSNYLTNSINVQEEHINDNKQKKNKKKKKKNKTARKPRTEENQNNRPPSPPHPQPPFPNNVNNAIEKIHLTQQNTKENYQQRAVTSPHRE